MSLPVYDLKDVMDELDGYEINDSDDLDIAIDEIVDSLTPIYYDDVFEDAFELYQKGYLDNIEGDLVENIRHAHYMYLKDEFYKHYDDLLERYLNDEGDASA